jgi:transcriptional regulator with XRE-family HTH domain
MGRALRDIREARGLTLADLAHFSGISASTIQKLEAGSPSTVRTLCVVAETLGVTLSDLLTSPAKDDNLELEAMRFLMHDMLADFSSTVQWYKGLVGSPVGP